MAKERKAGEPLYSPLIDGPVKWVPPVTGVEAAGRAREEAKAQFLRFYPDHCTVSGTAKVMGISRLSIFLWLDADPEFKAAYEALKKGPVLDTLEAEAFRRGHDGWDEPVYFKGELQGTVRKYSDTLLIMLMNGAAPEKYKRRVETDTINTNVNVQINERREQLNVILSDPETRELAVRLQRLVESRAGISRGEAVAGALEAGTAP